MVIFILAFVSLKLTCLVTLFDRNLQIFKKSPKWTIFGIFHELLSTQNVNVARFARIVECDFFSVIFKHRGLEALLMAVKNFIALENRDKK